MATLTHARTLIRNALQTALTGNTTAGSRVYKNRFLDHKTLPTVNIVSISDDFVEEVSGGNQLRECVIGIEIRAKQNNTLDDELDGIAAEVETAVQSDDSLGINILATQFRRADMQLSDEQETPIGLLTLEYIFWYRIQKGNPTTLIA